MNKEFLQIAKKAARKAGEFVREDFFTGRKVVEKNESGLHLQSDLDSEKIIIDEIRDAFPDHSILAEESGGNSETDNYLWIIDPIDGTSNYYFYNPYFNISIALAKEKELLVGVVYNPITGEMFAGHKGGGVYINDDKIDSWPQCDITKSVYGGYTNNNRCRHILEYAPNMENHHNKMEMASAALTLAYVATGRVNTYLLDNVRIWDVAAGVMLIREMGGMVTDWQGKEWKFGGEEMLASNDERIHEAIINKINDAS